MIGLIVAKSKNNVIGKDGKIPWNIKGEQQQFKKLTTGNVVIMGRRTYEEIGKPLPNRINIIVSRNNNYTGENLITVKSLDEALNYKLDKNIFIAGGYALFKEAIPKVDKMYITQIDMIVEDGDVFFPKFNEEEFDVQIEEEVNEDIPYKRLVYTRKK